MNPTTSISNTQVYGAHAAYKAPPSEAQADAGVVPLDTLPAAWWNQLWYDITSRNNKMVETVLNIRDEILSVLSDANITPSELQTNQLLQAIEVIRRRFPTFDAISHDPIPGSVISSAARNSVSVDGSTGQMTVNALSDWTSTDSVKKVIDNIDTSNPVQYSTSEFDMGKKWIDGKQIYGRVLTDPLVNFSQNTSFPSSYTANSFVIFNDTLYVATTRGVNRLGIYTSTDGITFTQNTSFPSNCPVLSFIIFKDTLYVGTNGQGIYTSTDGITFTKNTSFPSNYYVPSFIIFNDTLYAATNSHGIYISTDGITFTQNIFFPSKNLAYSFIIFKDTLYVGTNSKGIYTSIGIGFATALSNISELLFTQLRNSIGPLGLKSAHIDKSNHLVIECDGTPTQAIIEYTKSGE